MSSFSEFQLDSKVLRAIEKIGYTNPTPIQSQAIPSLINRKDLLGIAQTGTGKTAAFALPILHQFSKARFKPSPKNIRALILAPTRELASQINESFRNYGAETDIFSGVVFGGVGKKGQITMLAKGCEILVATPGRLLDLLNEGFVSFKELEVFVLDEADRMLDMGFIHDIKKIIAKLPKEKQTMLFSATMPKAIAGLANSLLVKPVKVEVTPESTTVEKIDQRVLMVDKSNKLKLLKSVFGNSEIQSALVFTRTKHGADRVVKELNKNEIESVAIHGNKSQGARERALKSFKQGKMRVLVATDIAARGIDIDRVSHVINYNLPEDTESYVHRIGRTARAGRDGVSISFCEATEVKLLKNIERFIRRKIPIDKQHEFHVTHTQEEIRAEEKLKKEAKERFLSQKREARKTGKAKTRNSQNARSSDERLTKKKSSRSVQNKPGQAKSSQKKPGQTKSGQSKSNQGNSKRKNTSGARRGPVGRYSRR